MVESLGVNVYYLESFEFLLSVQLPRVQLRTKKVHKGRAFFLTSPLIPYFRNPTALDLLPPSSLRTPTSPSAKPRGRRGRPSSIVHLSRFDLTPMVAEKDAAVTRPGKSEALAPRLRNKKRTSKKTTEVPNITAQELDLDERLDRLESGVRELRRVLLTMLDEVRSLKAEILQLRTGREVPGAILAPEPSLSESASSCITADLSTRSCADSTCL
ncbi:uncharacterized protein LOC115692890 [Syzygium oleosum]|uniref:uncharacterized protein LOC115692890 n=1 Tax=Syzygium oleosum TaxID=219896 RepID=UPI0024BAA071|nr:uncharacterized protein LOC115692890 [Syzygium oleosum]